ncbi:CDF family Co(II)/Ni(II) efflux transporter DmeF [Chlorobium limicola]|uniref:Cation transporter n=1 Tax=Chlorobium limicola TaxID=1092 RepID=A0A101J4Z7_CHLLI|nr:CDF family Co(II)/Ni(II) efflux transporter DmeF [Chlorobium limicola]KUL20293.1 cation transporter [Chlorobium limicola]
MQHNHLFHEGNPGGERNTRLAVLLTFAAMVAEIGGGWVFNSMALLADGWHMSSHVLALGLSIAAYRAARYFARDVRFAFGTWKIEVLAGYTSAIFLVIIAVLMFYESFQRLFAPVPVQYEQAIFVAIAGLAVNLACAWLLRGGHSHSHHTGYHHMHEPHHPDMNLRSAYIHVLTDAVTSVFALIALFGGKYWQLKQLDPLMGIAGSAVVAVWAYGLLRDSARVLLDAEMDAPVVEEVRALIAADYTGAEITDLHVWRVGGGNYACILSLAVDCEVGPEYYKRILAVHEELVHITVELNRKSKLE